MWSSGDSWEGERTEAVPRFHGKVTLENQIQASDGLLNPFLNSLANRKPGGIKADEISSGCNSGRTRRNLS
jgi:hypothetical protein